MKRILLATALCLSFNTAHAFPAIVEGCHDGDSCTVFVGEERIKVRLAGIDAPEEPWVGRWQRQPYADQAAAALNRMVQGTVDLECTGQQSYRREVCRITAMVDGKPTDVQREMVFQGLAWSAIQFEPKKDRDWLIPTLELDAREHHRGLWALGGAVPPWEWRHEGM